MSAHSTALEGVVADPLFVGLTRPAMAFGIPYAALLTIAVITVELFLLSRNLIVLLCCAPMLGLARLACAAEPRYFELWVAWVPNALRQRFTNARYWRAATFAPLGPYTEPSVRL